MGRCRSGINLKLPSGLRIRDGYFTYRCPIEGTETGLGRDRRAAIGHAVTKNISVATLQQEQAMAALVPEESIVAAALPINALCGVYFLVRGCKVVYVGQSGNVHYRLGEHIAKKVYTFDRFHIIPCEPREVERLEALYIAAFRPKYNKEMYLRLVANPDTVYGRAVG